eukprot:10919577-Alexandrium_andersonii.AAC.1
MVQPLWLPRLPLLRLLPPDPGPLKPAARIALAASLLLSHPLLPRAVGLLQVAVSAHVQEDSDLERAR